jgi:hypothetical protein
MADKDLKAVTPDTSLPTAGFLFGADSQSAADPSAYTVAAITAALAKGHTLAVLTPKNGKPTNTLAATLDTIVDGSTPASLTEVLDFNGAADSHYEWDFVIPSWYSGNGFTVSILYAMSSTDGDAVQFEFRMLPIVDLNVLTADLGMDTATGTDITDDPSTTANELNVTAGVEVTHANAGSPAAGSMVRVRITRDFDHAANANDAQFVLAYIVEKA